MDKVTVDTKAQEFLIRLEHLFSSKVINPNDMRVLEQELTDMLSKAPDFPKFQFLLGTLYLNTDRSGLAINMMKRAVDCGALGPAPYINMGVAYKQEHDDENSAACYRKALKMAEEDPETDEIGVNRHLCHAYHGLGGLYINAGNPDPCIHWAEKALKLDPNDRFALWNKGIALLERGDWAEGFRLYDEAGFVDSPTKPMERKLKTYGGLPKWDGTSGKTLICYGEQGVGDEIMFASMLPDLMKQCKVIIDCDKRLEKLFRESFPEAEAVYPTSNVDAAYPWIKDHKPDAYLPMGSLGRWFRKSDASFPRQPFLRADMRLRGKWKHILGGLGEACRVGISYAGGLKKTRFDKRTIELPRWAEILKTPGCQFYSLQYHPWAADEAAHVGNQLGIPIHHWGDMIANYDETAAFVSELDLVITVNTSLLHLCGALGVPTLCLTPKYVAWRYGLKGPNPFYGSVTMLRQSDDNDWDPVLRKVAGYLRGFVKQERLEAAE